MEASARWILVLLMCLAACADEPAQDKAVSQPSPEEDSESSQTESAPADEDPFAEYSGMMLYYARASAAESDGEFELARAQYQAGLELVPTSPHLLLGLARNAALLGERDAALDALERYAAIGAYVDLGTIGAFEEWGDDESFTAIALRIAPVKVPAPRIEPLVVLEPVDLWNEGIACDRESGDLFAGSIKHGRIVRIRDGIQNDFGTSAADGLMEVLGLDIDEQRRELWACTGLDEGTPGGKHDFGETPRANEIVVYSLQSGKLLRRYTMVPDGRIQMWNDVVVAPDGTAYFTDMTNAEVRRIEVGGEPELFLDLEGWNYPNGIGVSDDGRLLYVACLEGVLVAELPGGTITPLEHDDRVYTGLGDGMAVLGANLFLVQNNQLLGNRTLHCRLDATGRKVLSTDTLHLKCAEGQMPFTCAIDDKQLYLNATTSFEFYDSEEGPRNSVIFALEYTP